MLALLQRRKLTVILLTLYWPTIFVLSHAPIPQVVRRAQVSDKTIHFIVYFILVFLLWFTINPHTKVNWRKASVWWMLLVVVWYGVVDEWLQAYVGRNANVADFLANLTGMLAGLVLLSFFTFWPALLVAMAVTIFTLSNLAKANLSELVPFANAAFHLAAYAVFTGVWIRFIHHFLPIKAPHLKWFAAAFALPLALLLIVKSSSLALGRHFEFADVILSLAAIVVAVNSAVVVVLTRRSLSP